MLLLSQLQPRIGLRWIGVVGVVVAVLLETSERALVIAGTSIVLVEAAVADHGPDGPHVPRKRKTLSCSCK